MENFVQDYKTCKLQCWIEHEYWVVKNHQVNFILEKWNTTMDGWSHRIIRNSGLVLGGLGICGEYKVDYDYTVSSPIVRGGMGDRRNYRTSHYESVRGKWCFVALVDL